MKTPQLVVSPGSAVPLYLQLKSQLAYLIIAGHIESGSRLPTVRDVADELDINPGTVAQAYRELQTEGLVDGQRGRGTFVRGIAQHDSSVDRTQRQALLTETLRGPVERALSLGFSLADIQSHAAWLAADGASKPIVAFVGPTAQLTRKYSAALEHGFRRGGLTVRGIQLEHLGRELRKGALDPIYFVVTLASLRHAVETELEGGGEAHRVIPLTAQVKQETIDRLALLPGDTRACLVAEARSLHGALNLLANESAIGAGVPTALTSEPDEVARICATAELVIHTYSASDVLEAVGVPQDRRFELQFEAAHDSLEALSRAIGITWSGGETKAATTTTT